MRIVGIGASAGGLEAINEFFDHMPSDTGMAFVVIQHLSPDFRSMMDELLSKHTQMPITVVDTPIQVKPNNIYLISQDSNLIIENGKLKPVKRNDKKSVNLPIDDFFHTLGHDQQQKAIGVILSGTGTDGSRGIRTIKEFGGQVLVQDLQSAKFDGMIHAAMVTGMVDNALPPFAIAQALVNLGKNQRLNHLLFIDPGDDKLEDIYLEILRIVEQQFHVDFREYRRATLYRRIEKRMFLSNVVDLESYVKILRNRPKEVELLFQEFLIGVTRFFRDKEAFDVLATKVVPALCKKAEESKNEIRIWVTACSSGEEAYSIAMLLEEYQEQHGISVPYKIFATDLDAQAISKANRGVYGINIHDTLDPHYLDKYFEKMDNGPFRVIKKLRNNIVFTVHNALNNPPFINMDFISCRNFMIYLRPETQQRLISNFQFALHYQGFLFLGPSESMGKEAKDFEVVDEKWNVFQNLQRNKVRPIGLHTSRVRQYQLPSYERKDQKSPDTDISWVKTQELFNKTLLNKFAPLSIFVNEDLDVLHLHGDLEKILNFPSSPGSFNLNDMVGDRELLLYKNGVRKALETGKVTAYEKVSYRKKKKQFKVDIQFAPIKLPYYDGPIILINLKVRKMVDGDQSDKEDVLVADEQILQEERMQTLELELQQMRDEKQGLVERLETTNEELMATNEELQSTNEELQSVNEELYTVNSELQEKVSQLTVANSDMDNLLKSTEIGTIFVDRNLKIRKFTPAIKKQFNLLDSDIGRPITNFVNTFRDVDIYQEIKKVLQEQQKVEREVEELNGRSYLMRLLPYQREDQQDGVVATFIDISEFRNLNAKIEQQASLFRAIFEHTNAIAVLVDRQGRIRQLNKKAQKAYPKDLVGTGLGENFVLGRNRDWVQAFERMLRQKRSVEFKTHVQNSASIDNWYRHLLIPTFQQEEIAFAVLISYDMTGVHRVEEQIRRKADVFDHFFEYTDQHILRLEPDGTIKDINYTTAGYHKDDLIGKNLLEVSQPQNRQTVKDELTAIWEGEEHRQYQTEVVAPDGHRRWYQYLLFGVREEDQLQEIVMVLQDLTELKEIERRLIGINEVLETEVELRNRQLITKNEELEKINHYLDSFVYGAAHDLRAPITQIRGYINLLPSIEEKEDREAALEEISGAIARMERTLNGLVELIDFQTHTSPVPQKVNLKKVYEDTIADLGVYWDAEQVNIKVDIPEDLEIVYIGAYINSIFYNMLSNAYKYRSYERPLQVKVKAKAVDNGVVLIFSDNGIGIDLNRYGHFLFKPFKRLTVERDGTGIGLSIINNVVRKNGGDIKVDSKLDKGTTFTIYLKPYAIEYEQ